MYFMKIRVKKSIDIKRSITYIFHIRKINFVECLNTSFNCFANSPKWNKISYRCEDEFELGERNATWKNETLWNEILRYETVSWKVDVKKKRKNYLPFKRDYRESSGLFAILLRRHLARCSNWDTCHVMSRSCFKCGVETLFRSLIFIKEH